MPNDETKPENKAFTCELKTPRLEHGKPILNSAGETVYDKYIYNFDEMSVDRIFMAKKFFHLSAKNLVNLPKEPEHLEILADRQTEIHAYAALLMKQLDDGTFEIYDPSRTSLDIFQKFKGEEIYKKLEAAKEDFFIRTGLQSAELMMQSNGIMMQSLGIMKEIAALSGQAGLTGMGDMKELTQMILDKAVSIEKSPGTSSGESSTIDESIL